MVEEDRYCADILTQISSVHEALRSVGARADAQSPEALRDDRDQIERGPDAEAMYDELVEMMYKHSR